jgi:hypothetical protein
LHPQICAYSINKIWKYLVSYNDDTVGDVKDERETGIAKFLSEIKNRLHSCERLISIHSSWRWRIGHVASIPRFSGQIQEHKIVLMKEEEVLNPLPFLMTRQFSCCWMIFQTFYTLTAILRYPASFRLCHLCECVCMHTRTCKPWPCRKCT